MKTNFIDRPEAALRKDTVGENVHVENEVVDKWAKLVRKKEIVSPAENPGYIKREDTL